MFISSKDGSTGTVGIEQWGTKGSRALAIGSVLLVLLTPGDCDEVIRAAGVAKRQMLAAAEEGEQP